MGDSAILVAEIGCNHGGRLELARHLVELSARAGAQVVKFQKRCVAESLTQEQFHEPYANRNSFGKTYGEHRQHLELSIDEHATLKSCAERLGLEYACSVWDATSLREIAALRPSYIKIPSAGNSNTGLIAAAVQHWDGPIHVSLGMMTREEEQRLAAVLDQSWRRVALYACTSAYPTPAHDLALGEIKRLRDTYVDALGVGFSGHYLGIAPDIAALALGATWIERHFTDNRRRKGSDHAVSLLPSEFSVLRGSLDVVSLGLGSKGPEVLDSEIATRLKMKGGG